MSPTSVADPGPSRLGARSRYRMWAEAGLNPLPLGESALGTRQTLASASPPMIGDLAPASA